jgi:hypothetical protein
MAQVARTLSITYGSWVANDSTKANFQIQGKYRLKKQRLFASVSFTVWVVGATVEEFQTKCAEIEAAFETRQQRLLIKFGDTVFLDANPDENTGKNAEPSIEKPGSPEDSDTSRVYECFVQVNRPPTGSALTEESATIQYTSSNRRTLTITGQYNSNASAGALEIYRDEVEAFAEATKAAIGEDIVWQTKTSSKTENMTDPSGQNDRVSFVFVYQELVWAESLTATDNPTITDFSAEFSVSRGFPGDAPGHPVKRVITMTVPFQAPVDHLVTKDLSTVWKTIAKPWIISELKRTAKLSNITILDEQVNYNYKDNLLSGTLTISGVVNGASLLSIAIVASLEDDYGKEITKVLDGTPYGAVEDNAIPEKIRTITTTTERLGRGNHLGVGQYPEEVGHGSRWVKIRSSKNQVRTQYGDREVAGETYVVTRRTETWVEKWVTEPGSSVDGDTSAAYNDNSEYTGIITT